MNKDKEEFLKRVRQRKLDYPGQARSLYGQFVAQCEQLDELPEHYYRYCATLRTVENLLPPPPGRVLETGGPSILGEFLGKTFGNYSTTTSDLRYSIDRPDGAYDVVLSLEVLEHIKDFDSTKLDDIVLFNRSGARRYASEIKRVLSQIGICVLTTPNPCSYESLKRLVNNTCPFVFDKHVREYSRSEIIDIFSEFKIVHYETAYVFFNLDAVISNDIFLRLGGSPDFRGDDHIFVLK